MSFIGIDLGTSGVRSGAFSGSGEAICAHSAPIDLVRPGPGLAELDPDQLLGAVEQTLRLTLADPGVLADPPVAVSFSTLGEAVVPLLDGHPSAAAAISMDRRGGTAAARLAASIPEEDFQRSTGQPLHPMFSVFKVAADLGGAWIGAGQRYACVDAFVAAAMGAPLTTDLTMAARTGAFDVESLGWSSTLLSAIDPRLTPDAWPTAVAAGTQFGEVTQEGSRRFGLPVGTPIVAGVHDQAASWFGIGGSPGAVSAFALGSSDCLTFGTIGRPDGLVGTGIATYPLGDDVWVSLAGTAAGGWALEWFAGLVGGTVTEVFADLGESPSPALVLPYLAGSGTLDNDPDATGVVAGLTLGSTRTEVARGIVEAAGLELGKILAALTSLGHNVGRIVTTGGGSGNSRAMQARADAAGVSLSPWPHHASLRGAARLAARGVGADFDTSGVPSAPIDPDPRHVEWFGGRRAAYRDLYPATRSLHI